MSMPILIYILAGSIIVLLVWVVILEHRIKKFFAGTKAHSLEDVMIQIALPAGSKVVTTTGDGYQGVKAAGEGGGNVAVWRVPKMAATDRQAFTMTLSPAATTLRGKVTWGKPVAKADGEVNIQLAGARGRGPA